MKPAEPDELIERIRQAADRENGVVGSPPQNVSASSELPPIPESLRLPPARFATAKSSAHRRPETLLSEAASMLEGGRKKNAVPKSVPALLRQFFRNQGGVNGVLFEAVERLAELNRNLHQQNCELHERLIELHGWTRAATQNSAENRQWAQVVDARLRALTEERLARLEARVAELEQRSETT